MGNGYYCQEWTENETDNWENMYLCWPEEFGDLGFQWHDNGIDDNVADQDYVQCNCIVEGVGGFNQRSVDTFSNPLGNVITNDNNGNYLCVPRNAPYKFHWMAGSDGKIGSDGFNYWNARSTHCVQIGLGFHSWFSDNYLCAKPAVAEHACIPCLPETFDYSGGGTSKTSCTGN